MFKVEPLVPYAKDYNTCIEEAKHRVGNAFSDGKKLMQ